MFISPVNFINFTGRTKYVLGYGPTHKEQTGYLEKEARQAYEARTNGVDIPVYSAGIMSKTHPNFRIKYTVDGDMPDVKKNPVTKEHLKNLFKNFIKLEEIGLCHGLLDTNSVSYGKNGKVQLEAMRNADRFEFSPGRDTLMPSNAENYEMNGLCYYAQSIEDKDTLYTFLQNYLQQKSVYHDDRADLLVDNGYDILSKPVEAEEIKSLAFKNPSDNLINYTREKLEIYALKKEASVLRDKGNIFINHKAKPKKRFASSIYLLEALKKTAALEDKMRFYSENAHSEYEQDYYRLEKKDIKKLKTEIFNAAAKEGGLNFNDVKYGETGLCLGTKADEEFFNKTMQKIADCIKTGKSADVVCAVTDTLEDFYISQAQEWSMKNNRIYKQTNPAEIIPIEIIPDEDETPSYLAK